MAQVTGRVFITVGGRRIDSKEGAKLIFGGTEREPVLADTGPVGYSEKTAAPGVECVIPHTANVSLKEFQAMKDVPLVFDTDTGKSFNLGHAFTTKVLELSKGEVSLSFSALTCEEG